MNCQECGREIKRVYNWNGQALGIECYKKANPFYTDPAQAVYVATRAFLDDDTGPARLLPGGWQGAMKAEKTNAIEHAVIFGKSPAYWLAVLAHNRMARYFTSPIKSIGEFKKFV